MAGKHRKTSRRQSSAARSSARRGGSGLAAAAVGATSLSTALLTGTTTAVAPSVELMALITPANSTAQIFAGTTYYGTNYADPATYGPQQVVPFFLGPRGIADAISAAGGDPTVVLASGWGAGQTGTALGQLRDNKDPALTDIQLVILDNNSNRGAGGFWTTYAPFAPLLLTSAAPTPSDLGLPVLDVAYQYNINSDAPTDPTNVLAIGNSLAAYVYGYGGEQTADVPKAAIEDAKGEDADPAMHYHYVVAPDGTYTKKALLGSTTTYVTFQADGLPLTRPLRLIPGGDILADALDPTLTELVDAGYQDGKSIPDDPRVPQPMTPFSSLNNLDGVHSSVPVGLAKGTATAQQDLSSPTNLITKPLDEVRKLPLVSSLPLPNSTLTTSKVGTTGPNKVLPNLSKPGTSSSPGGANPVQKISDRVSAAVNKVTGGLHKDKPKDAPAD